MDSKSYGKAEGDTILEEAMSTGLIIAIVVVALILLALLVFVLPRARARSAERARERELERRRERAVSEHRTEAESRAVDAERAEQRARMAEQEARRERAESDLHAERAEAHERGMADDELLGDEERRGGRFDRTPEDEPAAEPERTDRPPARGA
jgi:FtsZ-interacting cell division protein ZipA